MNMECPICGNDCENLVITEYETPFEDIANHLFNRLIEKGYAVNYDNINMILEIIHEYMIQYGECFYGDDEEGSIG
jgi:hypothetical protein